jgi:prepilin-type N-terminal cleavage/methylation domain-containing protein
MKSRLLKCVSGRGSKGFTLIEVIVVAVIVLILAAVAIPLYLGYVKDARREVAANQASLIAEFLGANIQTGRLTVPVDLDAISRIAPGERPGDGQQQIITVVGEGEANANKILVPPDYRAKIDGDYVQVTYINDENIFGRFKYTDATNGGR